MKRQHILCKCWFLNLLALAIATPTAAAVSERDWKMLGDGLLTFDDVNQREWLDLSETQLTNFLGSPKEQYQTVVGETTNGGQFEGFVVPIRADVEALAVSAGIDLASFDASINGEAAGALAELLGGPLEDTLASGNIEELLDGLRIKAVFSKLNGIAGLTYVNQFEDRFKGSDGVMLYRTVVPEPTAIFLTVSLLVLLAGIQRTHYSFVM